MSTDDEPARGPATGDAPAREQAKSERGAFLAIGYVFVILGLASLGSDNRGSLVVFLSVGVVFIALSRVGGQGDRTGTAEAAPDAGGATERAVPPPGAETGPGGEDGPDTAVRRP